MGQKVHPGGMRVGVIHDWKSNWYTGNKDFADFLQEDVRIRKDIHGMTSKAVHININEIKRPELDAKLVAQSIAEQLENRVSFRRAMKRSLASAMRSGAQGVKVICGGRLGGGGGGRGRGGRPQPDRGARRETVEQPRTDAAGVSAEGRQQPAIDPQVEETPAPVVDAPDTTTPKKMHDDPT